MDTVYEELDEARAEIERLRKQYHVKLDLSESLNRAHIDQLSKNKELSSKLDKLSQELNQKEDETSAARQMCEELKCNLAQKEFVIRNLISAHDTHRADCNEKLFKYEEENRALALALDDANVKNRDQEQLICALEREVEGVKALLSSSDNKYSDRENRSRICKEFEGREDVFVKLDDEKRKFEDQLKWKKEQFSHLEEAHEKLRKEFRMREKEWENEKGVLLDGISSLETKLESQTRVSRDLQCQLEMCNEALAHAQSKRKLLEAELRENRTNLENICIEYEEAKLNFEELNSQRDQEIAALRSLLGTKVALYKESEYQLKKLEQEKKELLITLKELQEAQIQEAGICSPSSKLQRKLKSLEEAHRRCPAILRAKESEWHSQVDKSSKELDICRMELKSRDADLAKLELMNQEISLILLVLKSQFTEAKLSYSYLDQRNRRMQEMINELVEQLESKKADIYGVQKDLENERGKGVALSKKIQTLETLQIPLEREVESLKEMLKETTSCQVRSKEEALQIQLESKKADLDGVQKDLVNEREKVVALSKKIQTLEALQVPLEKEVERLREMLKETTFCQVRSEEEVLQIQLESRNADLDCVQKDLENEREKVVALSKKMQILEALHIPLEKEVERLREMLKETTSCQVRSEEEVLQIQNDLERVRDALDRANEELHERYCLANGMEFELQVWKSVAEQLESNLMQNHQLRREVEASLLAQMEVELNLKLENECLYHQLEEKEKKIDDLQQQLVEVNESMNVGDTAQMERSNTSKRETLSRSEEWNPVAGQDDAEKDQGQETESLHQLVEEKDQRIYDLQQLVASLEHEFESSSTSFSSQLAQMQKEINNLRESWEQIKAVEVMKEMEIQEKNMMIMELESDLANLEHRVEQHEKAQSSSKRKMQDIKVELEQKELEVYKLQCQLEARTSGKPIKYANQSTKNSSSENNNVIGTMSLLYGKLGYITHEDTQLMESLGKIVEAFDISRPQTGWSSDDEQGNIKENSNCSSSPLMKKSEAMHDERSPLRALNT